METCFEYTDRNVMYVSSTETKWINKITKLAEQYPNDVRIIKQPKDNDNCIYATVPSAWLKLTPPKILSEEERQRRRETLKRSLNRVMKND